MKQLILICSLALAFSSSAQEKVNIVKVIDELRGNWDITAIKMKNYQGIHNFCADKDYKKKTMTLLDEIHHWDTTLYFIVQNKYSSNEDEEAAATLEDIEALETEYSTENFKNFISEECEILKVIEDHFDSEAVRQYEKEIKKFEREMIKYVNSITDRVDIVDEHIHHLDLN
jgi:hypothetical protein